MTIRTLAAGMLAALAFSPLAAVAGGDTGFKQKGVASYYADRFHGRKTASGQRYNKQELTAAHKTLPLGTKVRVTNVRNGESVDVEITDRGPYIKGRVIDLSKAAARELGMVGAGLAQVRLEIIDSSDGV